MSVDFETVDGFVVLKGTAEAPLKCSFGADVEEVTLSLGEVLYVAKYAGSKCVVALKAGGGTITLTGAGMYEKLHEALNAIRGIGGMGEEEEESEEDDDGEEEKEVPVPKKKAKRT